MTILDFNPKQGPVGTKVTIQGRGFTSNPLENTLEFNDTPATVDTATEIQLETTVPLGATTGPVSVTVANITASSLKGSRFTFVGGANPPNAVTSPLINATGTSATMTVTVDPNASGLYAIQANNGSGSSRNTLDASNTFRILDPNGDEDNDGLNNADETVLGTDIFNPDTDVDGLSDGLEVAAGTDPLNKTITKPVACGTLLLEIINTAAEVDFFNFSGTAGDVIELTLTEGTGFTNTITRPKATVFSSAGAVVTSFFGTSQNQITLPETGTYLIRLNAEDLSITGAYSLGMNCLFPASPPPTALACGDLLLTPA